ncbi:translation initiation factor IF-2-like [Vespula pensylvanica]|uniref:translation initiation factor IF-2-like n=1 Tax=Vespula pensylvanica TaxID=30213 RepID=UPI001CBA1C1C|nr:translation initiation factor IF-2-like [Vespula pensylvanica]
MYEVPSTMKIYLAYFLLWGFMSNQQLVKATEADSLASTLANDSSVRDDAAVLDPSSYNWSSGDDQKSIDSKSSNLTEADSDGVVLAKAILRKPDDHVPESGGSLEATAEAQTKADSKSQARAVEDKANDEAKARVKATSEAEVQPEPEPEVQVKAEAEAEAEVKAEVKGKTEPKAEAEAKPEAVPELKAKTEEDRVRIMTEAKIRAEVESRVQTEVISRMLAQAKAEAEIQANKAAKAKANALAKAEAYVKASIAAKKATTDAAEISKRAVAARMKAARKSAAAQAALSDEETTSMRAVASAAAVQAAQMQALIAAQAGAIAQKNSFFQALTASNIITANAIAANVVENKALIVKQKVNETTNETQAAILIQSMANDEMSTATLVRNEALSAAITTSVSQIAALAEANAALQDILAVNVRHAELSERNLLKSFVPID